MKALGIDYGEKKIGLSLSAGNLAMPWKILRDFTGAQAVIDNLKEIILAEDISIIIIGSPLSLSGEKGKQARVVDLFIDHLKSEISIPVVSIDERMTSGLSKKLGAGTNDDAVAAAQILQTYLDKNN
jgi:putative Holliday junction resolvase